MNNLAQPAPKVEPASVERAPSVEAAHTEQAQQVEPATADIASKVGPAIVYDPKPIIHAEINAEQGISVDVLRGSGGADFESVAAVLRGAPKKNFMKKLLPFMFDERDFVSFGEVQRFVMVKGDCCFVFADENESDPLYAIPLGDIKPILEDKNNLDKGSVTISPLTAATSKESLVTVLLKYHDGSQAYQFTFDLTKDNSLAKRFYDVVQNAASAKSKNVTASVLRAQVVGKEAAKSQPSRKHNN